MTSGLVLCAVDRSEAGHAVLSAAKATGAPVLMVHVANSLLESAIPAFQADGETERLVDHGPTGPRLLMIAEAREAAMIVLGEFLSLVQWLAMGCVVIASIGATRTSTTLEQPAPD